MAGTRFCIECGKEDVELYNNVCAACFAKTVDLVQMPEKVSVVFCGACGALQRGTGWMPVESTGRDAAIERAVIDSILIHGDAVDVAIGLRRNDEDETNMTFDIEISARIGGCPCTAGGRVRAAVKKSQCDTCNRIAGGYYAGIVQIRPGKKALTPQQFRRIDRIIHRALEQHQKTDTQDRFAFITKTERVHGGIDYYLGSSTLSRAVAKTLSKSLATPFSESEKLVGMKNGKNQYRISFSVTVPDYAIDDYFIRNDRIHRVTDMQRRAVTARNLETGQKVMLVPADMDKVTMLNADDVVRDMILICEEETDIQVLDETTLKTHTLRKPKNFAADGDTVRVLVWNEKVIVV